MGFLGELRAAFARQLTASAYILGLLACSIEQPVSGPVSLTGEWKTIEPPEPLRVGRKELQEVCLQVVGTTIDADFEKDRLLVNGQWHVLGGEAVDSEQTTYGLRVGSLGGDTVCLYRAGKPTSGPDFPPDLTIVRLRLRSEPPVQVAQVRWVSHDQM
jgi:hypothetical protein